MARNSKKIKQRNVFYIVTNGRRTEKLYFDLIRKLSKKYVLKIVSHEGDPLRLVKAAANYVNLPSTNQVWCVFDVDNSYQEQRLEPAIKIAKENHIKCAWSNIAFEVWLLLHHQDCTSEMDNSTLIEKMNQLYKAIGIADKYKKADEMHIKKYFVTNKKYIDASIRARKLYENHVKSYNIKHGESYVLPIQNWNPCTAVYKIFEELGLLDSK